MTRKIARNVGRRKEDFIIRNLGKRYEKLYQIGQTITSQLNIESVFDLVIEQTNQIMETERSSLFVYDDYTDELWSLVATGVKKNEIRIKSDSGLAGWVFQNQKELIINDTYKDSRFNLDVDRRTGFQTQNILCVPVFNRERKCIGALEVLNRHGGDFTPEDAEFLHHISDYVAIAIENARLYEDVQAYTTSLEAAIILNEKLEKVKDQLTKFVPDSVVKMVEKEPDREIGEKIPMDVSILFIDIQEFGGLLENYDARLVNDMLESHFSKYLSCVGTYGGELNETAGDGLMIIFKGDSTHEHARNAVAAGLDIITENQKLNRALDYPWGDIQLHLGINTGEAYVGTTRMQSITGDRLTYTATGFVTVLAARIGSVSENTQLLIGPDTYALVQDGFGCDFVGKRPLKNISEPIPVYQVISNKAQH
jgi:class 3 adenylate cyclase/putative methionine-R-sulfoxide reductase with GAF domain